MRLKVAPLASDDIETAGRWWLLNRPAAPLLLEEELHLAFVRLVTHPFAGQLSGDPSPRFRDVRRYYLSGTGHFLYYKVTPDEVVVLRLWHASRGSSPSL